MRVLMVSASVLARGGMASVLAHIPEVTVLGSAGMDDAHDRALALRPDGILLDAGPAGARELDAIAALDEAGFPVVVLTAEPGQLSELLAAGASAVLPTDADAETLTAAVHAAWRGLLVIPRTEAPALVPAAEPASTITRPAESLTARELEVLSGMAGGLTNRQIALRLRISEHTVKFHAAAILGKLGARSRAEAVARGMQLGVILV